MLSFFIINIILIFLVLKKTNKLNPLYVWTILQITMYSGTFFITNKSNDIESYHFYLYSLFILCSNITAIFYSISKKRKFHFTIRDTDVRFLKNTFYISIIAVLFYFYLVGENLFVSSIKNIIITNDALTDVKDRRFAFYSAGKYVAPGFFNLFKNFLLPASFFSLILFDMTKRIKLSFLRKTIYWCIFLILILGTGQRGAFIMSFVFAFAIAILLMDEKMKNNFFIKLSTIATLFFTVSTIFLARNTDVTFSDFNYFSVLSESIINRFLFVNQYSGLDTFKYITENEVIQWGYDWLMMLDQFMPGRSSYLPLDNKSFNYVYGNFRGTNPPSLMVSSYYNFGVIGVILTPVFFVIICNKVFKYFQENSNNYIDYLVYILIYFALGTWVNSGIDYPIRNGILLVPVIIFVKKFKFKY